MDGHVIDIRCQALSGDAVEAIRLPCSPVGLSNLARSADADAVDVGLVRVVDDTQVCQDIHVLECLGNVEQTSVPAEDIPLWHHADEVAMGETCGMPVQFVALGFGQRRIG